MEKEFLSKNTKGRKLTKSDLQIVSFCVSNTIESSNNEPEKNISNILQFVNNLQMNHSYKSIKIYSKWASELIDK